MAAPLTEYERLRQERLQRNKLLLGSLGVLEAKEELTSALPPPRAKPKRVLGDNPKKRAPSDSGHTERRVSLRQRGLPPTKDGKGDLAEDADGSAPRARPSKEAQGLVLGMGNPEGARSSRGERARADSLELRSLNAKLAEDGSLARLLLRLPAPAPAERRREAGISGESERTAHRDVKAESAEEEERNEVPAGSSAKELAVTGLTLAQEDVAKVCKERIHNVLFLPTMERTVVVAGDKSGQLAIWNVHPREEDYRAPSSAEVETAGSGIGESIEKKAEDGNEEEGGDGCQGLHTFLIHESVVSGLAVPAWDHHASVVVYSCSYDGSVRGLDAQAQACPLILGPNSDSSCAFSALGSTPFLPHCLLLGSEGGELLLLDTRVGGGAAAGAAGHGRGSIVGRWEVHHRKVNTVSACPASSLERGGHGGPPGSAIATASTDNSVKLWDLRKMQASKWLMVHDAHPSVASGRGAGTVDAAGSKGQKGSPEFVLRRVKNPTLSAPRLVDSGLHSRGVNSAFFSPDGSKIVSTSYDDTVRVWDAQPWSSPGLEERARIRHNNNTGRWIASFRAVWACDSRHIILGGMGRSLDVLDIEAGKGKGAIVASLQSPEFMTTIPARCASHPSRMMFAGASASGRVYLWRHTSDA